MKVIRVEEYGHWPLPPQAVQLRRRPRARTSGPTSSRSTITQPEGPSFAVDGNQVTWQNWSFVIGFNAREGLTLHHLRYRDDGRDRSILYRASLTEMVVPYGDPRPTQVRKNAFDVGEYGMGMCANSLELGCDCLGLIHYFDAHLCDQPRRAADDQERDLHARGGLRHPLEAHRPPAAGLPEVRRSRRLVVSSVSTVENYEYGFFWYLYQDGNIQFEIKLTGILSLGALQPGEKSPYGATDRPAALRPEPPALLQRPARLRPRRRRRTRSSRSTWCRDEPGPDEPVRERLLARRPTPLETEKQARGHLNLETARTWKVVNPQREERGRRAGRVPVPAGRQLASRCASPNAWWRKRAGFVNHHVWVTPFAEAREVRGRRLPEPEHAAATGW